jgi:hypothetical protein
MRAKCFAMMDRVVYVFNKVMGYCMLRLQLLMDLKQRPGGWCSLPADVDDGCRWMVDAVAGRWSLRDAIMLALQGARTQVIARPPVVR